MLRTRPLQNLGWLALVQSLAPCLGLVVVVACALPGRGLAQEQGGPVESLTRLMSPKLRKVEERLAVIADELKTLPDVRDPWGSRYGHRSADLPDATTPDWLQLDLRHERRIDMLALVPVNLAYLGEQGAGYGFPKRFKVELSKHPDMRDAVVLVDQSAEDVEHPGKYPLVLEFKPVAGRYLRLTSLKHDLRDGKHFWALEEMMVMQGAVNVALESIPTSSTSMDLFPQWAPIRIVDGQSSLGMPVDPTVPSPTQGYLSDRLSLQIAPDPLAKEFKKWCAIDLGEPQTIEQIGLLPLESDAYEVFGGRGFPRSFHVDLAKDPEFEHVIWSGGGILLQLGYPDACAANITVPQVTARYIRLVVDRMWSRDDWYRFGLAEIMVYASGSDRNVALGKRVFVKDVVEPPKGPAWAPANLVDGYTSRYRLTEWPEYLRLMSRRGHLEHEKVVLTHARVAKLKFGRKSLSITTTLLTVLVLAAWIWGLMRHRIIRRHEAERLRQQIARDFHDDIGSNLGGIVLLSEIGGQYSSDEESRSDFDTIYQAATDASDSMRDIVWLIQRDRVGLKDFVTKMRQSAQMILKNLDVTLEVEPAEFRDRPLGLLFRRHVFLAFKEVLNNVRKHAQTERVAIQIHIQPKGMRFSVKDEGIGFDPDADNVALSGYGMGNLKRRAERVAGSIRIESAPGKGASVIFDAPFSK